MPISGPVNLRDHGSFFLASRVFRSWTIAEMLKTEGGIPTNSRVRISQERADRLIRLEILQRSKGLRIVLSDGTKKSSSRTSDFW